MRTPPLCGGFFYLRKTHTHGSDLVLLLGIGLYRHESTLCCGLPDQFDTPYLYSGSVAHYWQYQNNLRSLLLYEYAHHK